MTHRTLLVVLIALTATTARGQDLVRELGGFDDQVRRVAFSPDGKTLAVAGTFKTPRLVDRATGKEVGRLAGHTGWALWVAFAPDGKRLFTAGFDGTGRIWDVADRKELHRFEGHGMPQTTSVAVAPDGATVATTSYDGTIRLWEAESGKHLRTLTGHRRETNDVAFSPNGKLVASASVDGTVRLWEVATGKSVAEFTAHANFATSVCFSPDGRTLYSAGHDGTARARDLASGREIANWNARDGAARFAAVSPDGRTLAVTYQNGKTLLWETFSGKVRRTYRTDDGWQWSAAWSPDGRSLATSADRTVRLWDPTAGARPAAARDADALWGDLGGADAGKAYTASWSLSATPTVAVPLIGEKVKPVRVRAEEAERVAGWVVGLGAARFAEREAAEKGLLTLGRRVVPALQTALDGAPTAEQRRRLERLLTALQSPADDEILAVRAVEVLERAGGREAERILRALAGGDAGADLTQAAADALTRLSARD